MSAGRRRGRAARKAARADQSTASVVRPGLPGGQYKPLSDRDIERIHDAAVGILENTGIGDPIPEVLKYALPGGCFLNDDNRLCFQLPAGTAVDR